MKKPAPRAADVMEANPILLTENRLVREAAEQMWRDHAPAAVVIDERHRPLGIVSQQGLMMAMLDIVNHGMPPGPLRQYMDPALPSITEDAGLLQMAELFVRKGYGIRALAVVRGEQIVGLVLRRHVVHAVMEWLKDVKDLHERVLYLSALRDSSETPHFD